MTGTHWMRATLVAATLALPGLTTGCGEGEGMYKGPGGGPSSGAAGSTDRPREGAGGGPSIRGDNGPGSGSMGGLDSGANSSPRRGSAATGVETPGPG